MSHKVGEIAQRLDKIRDITTICLLLAMVFVLKFSQTFDATQVLSEDTKVDEIKIEQVEITQQVEKVIAPTGVKIPVAMTEEEEDTEEGSTIDIEEADFDVNDAPPPPPPPPSAKVEEEEVVDIYVVQEKPDIIGGGEALAKYLVHPPMAKRSGTEGKVMVRFVVSKDGVPGKFEIMKEAPKDLGFGQAAVDAITKVRFKPGIQGDKPVAVRMILPINFSLKK